MARRNIRTGPITQFWRSDSPTIFRSRKTSPISSYLTLANAGYIMRMSPRAIGMFVVPAWNESMNPSTPGTNVPRATPAAMAAKIQNVSQRSRKESFLAMASDIRRSRASSPGRTRS